MDILLIGSGGREHAIAKKVAQNPKVKQVYCAPGNGGTSIEGKCVNIALSSIEELKAFAIKEKIGLTIVGPENPLIDGIVDQFKEDGLKIFGPSKKAAQLEGSKSFSKDFMKRYNVKTATYEVFNEADKAIDYLKKSKYPVVIKADGPAAGKGVYICNDYKSSMTAIKEIMIDDVFNGSGKKVVIEEYLEGIEASILAITDGRSIKPFISAKDHKQIFNGGEGPNTGGMGVLAPNPFVNEKVMEEFKIEIMEKTLLGIKKDKLDFCGIIFFGIMLTKKGVYLLEYNVRMGDPETQSVLELMESDFLELILSATEGNLDNFELKWKNKYCCNVVLASEGYPANYQTGYLINLNNGIKENVIFAGAKLKNNKLVTSGGRVLSILGIGNTQSEAISNAYANINHINFENMYYRTDIGK